MPLPTIPQNAPLPSDADEDIDVMIGQSPGHQMHPDPETGTVPVATPLVPDLTDLVGDVISTVDGAVTTADGTTVTSDGTVVTADGTVVSTGDGSTGPGGAPVPPPPPPPVDGGQVAAGVVAETVWPGPGIGHDPHGPETPPLVHLETWLYVTSGYVPHQRQVSQGGATVTVRWQPTGTEWKTGDGDTESCASAGEPYPEGVSEPPLAPCGHTYTEPSDPDRGEDTFTLQAAVAFHVTWTCTGNCTATSGVVGTRHSEQNSTPIPVRQRFALAN